MKLVPPIKSAKVRCELVDGDRVAVEPRVGRERVEDGIGPRPRGFISCLGLMRFRLKQSRQRYGQAPDERTRTASAEMIRLQRTEPPHALRMVTGSSGSRTRHAALPSIAPFATSIGLTFLPRTPGRDRPSRSNDLNHPARSRPVSTGVFFEMSTMAFDAT